MYAIARLGGYREELGFRAWLARDIADALGIRVGDAVRLESRTGATAARVAAVEGDLRASVVLTLDAYMAVSGYRTVLVRRLRRAFEASAVSLRPETPMSLQEVRSGVNLLAAYRVPVFSSFSAYIQREDGTWARLWVRAVEPREPAYLTAETRLLLGVTVQSPP